jgi:predicted transcriptional regulator
MPKEPTVRTTVLLPESLYKRLQEIAEAERRSAHKQIIYALEQFVAERQKPPEPQP